MTNKIPFPSFNGGQMSNGRVIERKAYPYSLPGEAKKLWGMGCFHDFSLTSNSSSHISKAGHHRLYGFDHLLFVTHKDHRKRITESAARLMHLTQSNCGHTRMHTTRYYHQLEMWPTISGFEAFVILTTVEFKGGAPNVFVDSAMLLAFDAMLMKFKLDKEAYDNHVADNKRLGLNHDMLPAVIPQLYFVDERTGGIFCFTDADRQAFFGSRPIYQILSIFKYGQRVNLIPASKVEGRMVLISMQMESKPEYRENPTDLCLETSEQTIELITRDAASIVGITTYVNLSGYTAVGGVEITSLVCRPQGTYGPGECPICDLKLI